MTSRGGFVLIKKFFKFLLTLALLVLLFAVLSARESQSRIRKLFNQATGTISEAVESVLETVDEVVAPTEEELSYISSVAENESISAKLNQLSRYFPNGSYFTVDASPCVHSDGKDVCPENACAYGNVVQALQNESWWGRVYAGDWECSKPEACGSEAFARFLYHVIRETELDETPAPEESFELTDPASVSDMMDALHTGDLIRFCGEQEHWAVFLEKAGINVYLYEANRNGCAEISYRQAETIEELTTRFSGYTAEIYR